MKLKLVKLIKLINEIKNKILK